MPKGKNTNAKRGASNPKMKKYPRISDYLQARHPKVYDIIENLAMQGSLSPRRGGGITFLLPDSTLIAKINKLIESDSPEEATDIVSSLILTEYIPTFTEFAAMKDDIPTLLGKKLGVKNVSKDKVDIAGGTLTPDSGFKPFDRVGTARRENMAVWELKGEVDYKNAPSTGGAGRRRGKKRGGAVGGAVGGATQQEIDEFVQDVVQREYHSIRDCAPGEKRKSPMLRAVVNQLKEWRLSNSDCYDKARSIMSLHPIIAFFLIYKNRLYFPASCLSVVDTTGPENAVDLLKEFMNDKELSGEGLIIKDPKKFKDAVQEIKNRNPVNVNITKIIRDSYQKLDEQNRYFALGDVYPAAAAECFKNNPGLHLLIDEFRHFLYASIKEMNCRRSPYGQAQAFNELVRQVNCFRSLTQPRSATMDKPDILEKAKDAAQIKGPFWETFALFVPCPWFDSQVGYAYTGAGEDGEDDEDGSDEDIEAEGRKALEGVNEPGSGYEKLAEQIAKIVKVDGTRKELEDALSHAGVNCEFHVN